MKFSIILLLSTIATAAQSARIFAMFPFPSISHQIVFRAITQELARRGHELVIVTPDPAVESHPNITQIDTHNQTYFIDLADAKGLETIQLKMQRQNVMGIMRIFIHYVMETTLNILEVKNLIEDANQKFDLVLVENLFPAAYIFGHRFNAPKVGISSLLCERRSFAALGNPTHLFLYPHPFGRWLNELGILDKLEVLSDYVYWMYLYWKYDHLSDALIRRFFGDDAPSIAELEVGVDLQLVNCHPLLCGLRPLVPQVINLGSIHIQPKKELPKVKYATI